MFIRQSSDIQISQLPDQLLISKYQETGQHAFFSELYGRYVHLVFGNCLNHLKNREEAKDMCMLIFEKLFDKLAAEQPENFQTWIYHFTKNECISSIRKRQSTSNQMEEWKKNENSAEIFMENEGFMRLYNDNSNLINREEALKQAISQLGKAQRKCIRLFYLKRQSYKQIAKLTRSSVAEVKSHLQNGKRKLRMALEDIIEKS